MSASDEIAELEVEGARLSAILDEIARRIAAYEQAIEPSAAKVRRLQRLFDTIRENERSLRNAPIVSLKESAKIGQERAACLEALVASRKYLLDVQRGVKAQRTDFARTQELLGHVVAARSRYGRLYAFPVQGPGGGGDEEVGGV